MMKKISKKQIKADIKCLEYYVRILNESMPNNFFVVGDVSTNRTISGEGLMHLRLEELTPMMSYNIVQDFYVASFPKSIAEFILEKSEVPGFTIYRNAVWYCERLKHLRTLI